MAARGPPQLRRQLHALGLAAGERRGRLARRHVAEAHVVERLERPVDLREVREEVERELSEYESLGDFFTRGLREGARVIDDDPRAIISPCDGVIAARGIAQAGTLVQAKGRNYRLADLVADDDFAARLTGGAYTTIYLSPRDYHRVHTPVNARIDFPEASARFELTVMARDTVATFAPAMWRAR